MNWNNLKKNKCPDCGKDWLKMGNAEFTNGMIICKCGFKISEKKMALIVNDKVNKAIDDFIGTSKKLADKYGTTVSIEFGGKSVVIAEPEEE